MPIISIITSLHQEKCCLRRCRTGSLVFLLLLLQIIYVNGNCLDEPTRSCESICSTSRNGVPSNCTVRALVILPDDDYYMASLKGVLPILKVAEQHIKEQHLVPSYINFEWMPKDDKCDASLAVINAMNGIVKQCAHVIFGPICDYSLAAVGRITKYFNSQGTPLISVGGSTYDFEKKKTSCSDEFYMLIRTGMLSFETISEFTISMMKRFHWTHSIFFYERDGQKNVAGPHTCFLMLSSLGKQMRKENMTFSQYALNTKMGNRTVEMKREIGNKHSGYEPHLQSGEYSSSFYQILPPLAYVYSGGKKLDAVVTPLASDSKVIATSLRTVAA